MGRFIDRTCVRFGERLALVSGDHELTYSELNGLINRLANALLGLGLSVEDRVGVLLPNGLEWVVTDFALMKAGLAHVRLHTMLNLEDFEYLINDANCRAIICAADLGRPLLETREMFPAVAHWIVVGDIDGTTGVHPYSSLLDHGDPGPVDYSAVQPSTIANIRYTAGTTGRPKGAAFPHAARLAGIARYLAESASTERGVAPPLQLPQRTLSVAPLTHAAATHLYWTFGGGGANFVPPRPKWDPEWVGRYMVEAGITHMFLVPTMIYDLFEACDETMNRDVVPLETLVYGAAPMTSVLLEETQQRFGDILVQLFGLTEADGAFAILDKGDHAIAPTSVGRPFVMTGFEIWGDDDQPLPPGETGEVVGWGLQMMSEYINQPEATAQTIVQGNKVRTGDLGEVDERGYLYFHERKDDMIISGGLNVYPREVEDALTRIRGVGQVAVVGRAHERWGQEVVAVVVRDDDQVELDTIREQARGVLAGYKCPKAWYVVDDLPRSQTGKVLRREVRQVATGREPAEFRG